MEIPQERYTQRSMDKSWLRREKITFSVGNTPGFNMHAAFVQSYTGLDGRDDPVLEDANGPVSCRILVR
jgi:hypothetical protein